MKTIEQKRKEAQQRQATREMISDEGWLKHLDIKLGKGVGAKKERARIAARIEKNK